eukprot:CAMPEP_0117447848 /NCGR_PEP_ID=MMETSP0759-20121206/7089_1 /TAXON_ID=63605 /ORGANISM="Percolomonas cosmopolitus, Strain WS" /LENGTH=990 /DNA_ID=CAMNT_0005240201 /DNA_START=160 /DNA_END=3132 /DNA_ORIENTATION=-
MTPLHTTASSMRQPITQPSTQQTIPPPPPSIIHNPRMHPPPPPSPGHASSTGGCQQPPPHHHCPGKGSTSPQCGSDQGNPALSTPLYDIVLDSAQNLSRHMDVPKYRTTRTTTTTDTDTTTTDSTAKRTERFFATPTSVHEKLVPRATRNTVPQMQFMPFDVSLEQASPRLPSSHPTSFPLDAPTTITKSLARHPTNVPLWIHYVHLQDRLVPHSPSTNNLSTTMRKVAILENALKHNPTDCQLASLYMHLQQHLLDREHLSALWHRLFHQNKAFQATPVLWTQYIHFHRHSLHSFDVEHQRRLYATAFRAIDEHSPQEVPSSPPLKSEMDAINLLTTTASFEMEAGYVERAVAVLQANLEFNVLNTELHDCHSIESFKSFWMSEAPRIGEEGAVGWRRSFAAHRETSRHSERNHFATNAHHDQLKPHVTLPTSLAKSNLQEWLQRELSAHHPLSLEIPLKPLSDAKHILTQPDAFSLFDDIEPFILHLHNESDAPIYCMFLWSYWELLYTQHSINDDVVHRLVAQREDLVHLESIFSLSTDILASLKTKFDWKPHHREWSTATEHEYQIVKRVLTLALEYRPHDTILRLTLLDLESQRSPQNALNHAQKILHHERNNVILWNFYAQLSYKLGAVGKAKKIFDLALAHITSKQCATETRNMEQSLVSLIFRTYAELQILGNDTENALHVLISMAEHLRHGAAYKPRNNHLATEDRIKSARDLYNQLIEDTFHSVDDAPQRNIELPFCAALFFHLTADIHKACQVFEHCTRADLWPEGDCPDTGYFSTKTLVQEHPIQVGSTREQYVHLLYLRYVFAVLPSKAQDGRLNLFPEKRKRGILLRALHRFPTHPLPLALLSEQIVSTYTRILTRRIFDSLQLRCNSPIIAVFSVFHELKSAHSSPQRRIARVRKIIERALQHERNQSNIMLWRLYLRFEQNQGDTESANKIRIRALQHCPHSKSFGYSLDEESLQSMAGVMIEKGIRVGCDEVK